MISFVYSHEYALEGDFYVSGLAWRQGETIAYGTGFPSGTYNCVVRLGQATSEIQIEENLYLTLDVGMTKLEND